ncbi:MAG TPA: site-2 protease family protein [Luteolibacter sp.]|nr:site-2 protease family protein [Luteolibacter sp.]
MIRFSLFGIPVRVHPFFWLTLAIIGGALGADSPEAMLRIGLFLLAGFVSILVHELGHALTARKFGAHSEIVLQAFGGYAAYSGVRMTRPQSFMITAAGPAVQIVLGLAVLMALPWLPELNQNALYFLLVLYWISLVWAVLNLLPVLPLDGGQMLNAILGPERIKTTLWVSLIVAVTTGLLLYLRFNSILALIFMGMFAWQAWQALRENRWR